MDWTRLDKMKVFFRTELDSAASSMYSMFDETDGRKFMKPGCALILFDVLHSRNAMQMLQEPASNPWTDGHLCGNLIVRLDGDAIMQAEVIKLKMAANTSTVIVRTKMTVLNAMNALVTCAEALLNLILGLCHGCPDQDMVEDTMSFGSLPMRSRETYIHYVQFENFYQIGRSCFVCWRDFAKRWDGQGLWNIVFGQLCAI